MQPAELSMNSALRAVARLIPRSLRNHLKSPRQSWAWWRASRRPPVQFSPGFGLAFQCPELAVTAAFHLQQDDPEQAAEFAEFMTLATEFRDPLFFDIGCHFGIFSFAVVDRFGPGAKAIAIDPSNSACAMVRRIAEINGWTQRIDVLLAAAGEKTGELEMVDGGVQCAGYFMLPADQPKRDRIVVPQKTIDSLAAEYGRKPDIVKIDVEGFEREVLIGGRQTLEGGAIPICLEIHNHYMRDRGLDPACVTEELLRLGYRRFTCAGKSIDPSQFQRSGIIRIVARK
jgi:FkbM family methyltransferase